MKSPTLAEMEDEYRRYLSEVRALSPQSVKSHIWIFRRFRDFLKTRRVSAARRVSLRLVYAFLEKCSGTCARRSMKDMHRWIRSVLRFLHFARVLPSDLTAHMITPRTWQLVDVPEAFSDAEVATMLASLRARTPYERRERAVLMLFIFYGLRLGEVTGMDLGDINLGKKTITIRNRKNREPLALPLLPPVEEALWDYLARSRPPDTTTSRLFVTIHHRSRAALGDDSVSKIVKGFLHRCGIEGTSKKFRHTLATRLVNNGVRLKDIAGLLGHRGTRSASIYTKVHLKTLREVAQNYSMRL